MVVIESSKKTKVLWALITVWGYAMLIQTGLPLFLDYMASHALPDYTFWLAAVVLIQSAPRVYSVLLGDSCTDQALIACRD